MHFGITRNMQTLTN